MLKGITTFVVVSLLAMGALAANPGDPESLQGTWEAQNSGTDETWSLDSKKDVQTIVRKEGGKVTLSLICRPGRGECTGMDDGKKARVSMYASGAVLVHWEVRDANLILRRFVIEGQTLTIEAKQLTSRAKPRTIRLIRRRKPQPSP